MIKLIGLVIVAVGFAFRMNPLLVVVAAGLVTGLVAGLSWHEVVTMLGQFFVDNRWLTLPVSMCAAHSSAVLMFLLMWAASSRDALLWQQAQRLALTV
jgi:uncharacterized membrane protein